MLYRMSSQNYLERLCDDRGYDIRSRVILRALLEPETAGDLLLHRGHPGFLQNLQHANSMFILPEMTESVSAESERDHGSPFRQMEKRGDRDRSQKERRGAKLTRISNWIKDMNKRGSI